MPGGAAPFAASNLRSGEAKMRLKELRGLPVIDPTAAHKVGIVTDYQVDPVAGRLAALDISPAEKTGGDERILAHRIRRVGRHAVILTARAGSTANAPVELNEHWLDTASMDGLEVIGDDGNRIGRLGDATFDPDSLEIDAYLLNWTSFWQRLMGRGRIQPAKVHACSRELMIVVSGRMKEQSEPSDGGALAMPRKVQDRVSKPDLSNSDDTHPVPVENGPVAIGR
jgi:sporulation protein YlmC with PRC-barrel domain